MQKWRLLNLGRCGILKEKKNWNIAENEEELSWKASYGLHHLVAGKNAFLLLLGGKSYLLTFGGMPYHATTIAISPVVVSAIPLDSHFKMICLLVHEQYSFICMNPGPTTTAKKKKSEQAFDFFMSKHFRSRRGDSIKSLFMASESQMQKYLF